MIINNGTTDAFYTRFSIYILKDESALSFKRRMDVYYTKLKLYNGWYEDNKEKADAYLERKLERDEKLKQKTIDAIKKKQL